MTYNRKDFSDAVADAMYTWLQDHPVSLGEAFQDAVKDGVTKWLDAHDDELLAAIAERATK